MTEAARPRPIVHIGYHKTATTWLQKAIFPAATSHAWVPRATTQKALLSPPGMHFDADATRAVLGMADQPLPVVLSEENLSGYPHNGGLHGLIGPEMARRIHAALPDARIVVFIRNQPDIVRSTYAQYVSGGGTWGLSRYLHTHSRVRGALTRAYKAPAFEFEHFEFDRLITIYDELFGADRVHVFAYEALRDRDAILARLLTEVGLTLPEDFAPAASANRSFGPASLLALRFVNLFTRQSVVNKSWLIDLPGGQGIRHGAKWVLGRLPGSSARGHRLPDAVHRRVVEHYAASNRRLAAMLDATGRGLPLAELGYPLETGQVEAGTARSPA